MLNIGGYLSEDLMDVFLKQPNDVLDYDIDLTPWFEGIPGDSVASVDVSVSSINEPVPTLVVGPLPHPKYILMGNDPTVFKLWIGGGTDRREYKVTCVVKTVKDRTKEVDFKIKVRNL